MSFWSYADTNANGQADDGQNWTFAANAATTNDPVGRWTATWNTSGLPRGQYLVGARATDAEGNTTASYITTSQVAAELGATPPNYANPSPTPGLVTAKLSNTCGTPPPSVSKTANPSSTTAGQPVDFTISVNNTRSTAMTVSSVQDRLPPGFSYVSTSGTGTLGTPSSAPTSGATGTLTWTFPTVTVPANSSRTLVFRASAPSIVGTYSNNASATTSAGTLDNASVEVGVGAPRLTIGHTPNVTSRMPGENIVYTVTYANDATVSVTNAVVSVPLPSGLTFVSAPGATYTSATRTISWPVGPIAAGDGPFALTYTATVDTDFIGTNPVATTATLTSDQTSPSSASTSVYINGLAELVLQQMPNPVQVAAGNTTVLTIDYANIGAGAASSVVLTEPVPSGWTFVSATASGTLANGVVQWNIGNVAAGATGSVQLTLRATNPYTGVNPTTVTATIDSNQTNPVNATATIGVTQGTQSCATYYFRAAQVAVGAGTDGGSRLTATTAAATGTTATTISVAGGATGEVARFYQDPTNSAATNFAGNIDISLYITKASSPLNIDAVVYDYDPVAGTKTQLGTASYRNNGQQQTNALNTFSIAASGTLTSGHRLLWVFQGSSNNPWSIQYDATGSPSQSTFCVAPPPSPVLDARVDKLFVAPGGTLQYTIPFANTGQASMTSATLINTLPDGVTFSSATINGTTVSPTATSGQQLTFAATSTGAASGTVAGGGSGTLVINAVVQTSTAPTIKTLRDTVILRSSQIQDVSASATTALLRPQVSISKSADKTLLIPGDTVTFNLRVQNTGDAAAAGVTVSDVLPTTAYFTYVAGSTKRDGVTVSDGVSSGTLSHTVGSLAVGATTNISFQMLVAATGVPDGVTTRNNSATVSDNATTGTRTSNTATVAISANPNLTITKTSTPATGPLGASQAVVYTVVVRNVGASDATSVMVQDPIPAYTTFQPGTITVQNVSQTDSLDGDRGGFDAVGNRLTFDLGTLAAGASRTLTYEVTTAAILPSGTTTIGSSAVVSAANAATKTAAASITAVAAPNLQLLKQAPSSVPYPVTTLSAAASGTTITVADPMRILIGDIVVVNSTVATVTGQTGNSFTLNTAVNAASGAQVLPTFEYTLLYANDGTANSTATIIQDALPTGLSYVGCSGACTTLSNTVTWEIGTLNVGQSGQRTVRVRPSGRGTYANTATIRSAEVSSTSSNTTTTNVGSLIVSVRTTTPLVTNSATGTQATYELLVENQLATQVTSVVVTDVLPAGFTYARTTSVSGVNGAVTRTSTQDPASGSPTPSFGTWTIDGGTTLRIVFVANIAANVPGGVYENPVSATASISALPFDELATTIDDVTVQVRTLAGTVFDDPDTNAIQGQGENGRTNAVVEILDAGSVISSTTTTADGTYLFGPVPSGDYSVRVVRPSGYTVTRTNPVPFTMPSSGSRTVNFGLAPAAEPTATNTPVPTATATNTPVAHRDGNQHACTDSHGNQYTPDA